MPTPPQTCKYTEQACVFAAHVHVWPIYICISYTPQEVMLYWTADDWRVFFTDPC